MCGIHGAVAVTYDRNLDDYIKDSFVAGSLRGMDSSGIAQVYDDESYELHKLPVRGSYFVEDKAASGLIREANKAGTTSICHTRAATVGSVKMNTAHPFEVIGDDGYALVGVHNGTLTNWRTKKGATKFDVDSEWALNHLQSERADAFEDFTGAFCFVWWDARDANTLNIARNNERPMHVVMLESGGMAYASEAGMLYWLLERRDVKMKGPIMELEAGYWYKFPMDNPANFSKSKFPEATVAAISYSSHYPSSTPYETSMEKVRKLFKKSGIPEAISPLTDLASRKSALVSQEEFEKAKEFGWTGDSAIFTPYMKWSGSIEGVIRFEGAELEAELRGLDIDEFDWYDEWPVTIAGVKEESANIMAVVVMTAEQRTKVTGVQKAAA